MEIGLINLGTVNKNCVVLGNLRIWFSYKTPVGFRNYKTGKEATRVNSWSNTTGKLLNELEPNKKERVEGVVFEEMLAKELSNIK